MAAARKNSTLSDPFQLTMLIFAIIAFMYFTGEVLKPLALSVLLCFALAPAVRMLERVGLPRVAAVVVTVLVALATLGGVGYVVGRQLTSLANRLPDYQDNIENKIRGVIKPGEQSATDKLKNLAAQVTAKMEEPPAAASGSNDAAPIQRVEVVSQPSFQDRLRAASGPYLEFLGVSSFVLILVLFMLINRKDLSDRIIVLFGHRQVSLTTRTMEEIGQRISRYLATFAAVNSGFGFTVGLGLALIGVPYAILWGCLAAMLRFIPYVGPAVAFVLPLVFSFAHFPGWTQPLLVVALFGVIETALNSFIEPIIYGKTTGVSALGLLVAAMFWTWLWGTMGLLLSTPLTVCLAVLGKYVPSLQFFATLLGEEADLAPDVRLYQRLVGLDRAGAVEVVEEMLKQMPRVEVFDQVLVPALTRAERDAERDALREADREFAWQVIGEVLDSLEGVPDLSLASVAASTNGSAGSSKNDASRPPVPLVGLAVQDTSDALVLRMLGQVLAPASFHLEIIADADSSLQMSERVAEHAPGLVVVSHLPPEGLTTARYLVRRLRAQFSELPIIVGRWGESGGAAAAAERLTVMGATDVVFTLADARDRILKTASTRATTTTGAAAVPATSAV